MCPSPLSPVCQVDQVLHVEAPSDQLVHGARSKQPYLSLQTHLYGHCHSKSMFQVNGLATQVSWSKLYLFLDYGVNDCTLAMLSSCMWTCRQDSRSATGGRHQMSNNSRGRCIEASVTCAWERHYPSGAQPLRSVLRCLVKIEVFFVRRCPDSPKHCTTCFRSKVDMSTISFRCTCVLLVIRCFHAGQIAPS